MNIDIITQLIITIFVPILTQVVKKVQAIPINEGQTARIRTFVAVTTFVLTATTAYLNGNLQSVLSPEMIQVGIASTLSFALAHFGYKAFSK